MATVNKAGLDWMLVKKWATDQIEASTTALIQSDENGDQHRGQIKILNRLIEWVEPDPLPDTPDVTYD